MTLPEAVMLLVGGVWGAITLLLTLNNASLRTQLRNATQVGVTAIEGRIKAEAALTGAREVFEQQLKRPVVVLFNDEQVVALSDRLIQLLFIPAAQAVKRELSDKKQ